MTFSKRIAALLLSVLLVLSLLLGGCASKTDDAETDTTIDGINTDGGAFYDSIDDVTVEKLLNVTMPDKLLATQSAFEMKYHDDNEADGGEYACWVTFRYATSKDIVMVNQLVDYDNGKIQHIYFNNAETDPYVYVYDGEKTTVSDLSQEDFVAMYAESLFGLEYFNAEITERREENGCYILDVDATMKESDKVRQGYHFTVDPQTGFVKTAVLDFYYDNVATGNATYFLAYGDKIKIDTEPKDMASDDNKTADAGDGKLVFETVDMQGNTYTEADFADAKVIMLNLWEPWCGPCCNEMPELEKLYENYKDKGLVIIGAFSNTEMDEDAEAVIESCGITYPILRVDEGLAAFNSDYYPTTVFFDGEGNMLCDEPQIGALDYDAWEALLLSYLQ